jgi:capsule polysaccharide export protein KpsE/RkpR
MIESIAALQAKLVTQEAEVQPLRAYSIEQNPELELAERELSSLQAELAGIKQQNHSAGFGDLGTANGSQVCVCGAQAGKHLRASYDARTILRGPRSQIVHAINDRPVPE